MISALLLDLLKKVLFESGKRGVKELFARSPAKRAISQTAEQFPRLTLVEDALTRWCQSDVFADQISTLNNGEESRIDDALINSFIDIGRFHDGISKTHESANCVLQAFAENLEHELFKSSDAPFIEEKRANRRYNHIVSDLRRIDERIDALPSLITSIPDRAPLTSAENQPSPFIIPPLPSQSVIGRKKDLTTVMRLLVIDQKDAVDVPPVALWGMAGIGKTTVAIQLGHRQDVRDLFPDGVLWTVLGPGPGIRSLLTNLADAFKVDLRAERDDAACVDVLRDVLHERRALIVVDDVWEIPHAQYFRFGGPYCRMLLTTREFPIAQSVTTPDRVKRIDVLTPSASLTLLRKLAPQAVSSYRQIAQRLCERLEFLPLALKLAGQMLANEAGVPSRMRRVMEEIIERPDARMQLPQPEGRLGLKKDESVSLQAILGMSVERLDRSDQERFAQLAVFAGELLNWNIKEAAYVWQCSDESAEETTSRLIQRGLVDRRGEYYSMHALLADYARGLMETWKL